MSWINPIRNDRFIPKTSDIISESLGIPLFDLEDESEKREHAMRLAWSLAGRRMLSSLFDETESAEKGSVSIFHVKRAFSETYTACLTMFGVGQQIDALIRRKSEEAADKAFKLYLKAGFFQKSPYNVRSSLPTISCIDANPKSFDLKSPDSNTQKAYLLRGIGPGLHAQMSGIGPWLSESEWLNFESANQPKVRKLTPENFIGLPVEPADQGWKRLLSNAKWRTAEPDEYPNFEIFVFHHPGRGIWKNSSETSQLFPRAITTKFPPEKSVTIARAPLQDGKRNYFLCRKHQEQFEISQISDIDSLRRHDWLIAATRNLGNNPICWVEPLSGAVSTRRSREGKRQLFVRVRVDMLPSVETRTLLKVFSWPESMEDPKSYIRIIPINIWEYFETVLSKEGFDIKSRTNQITL